MNDVNHKEGRTVLLVSHNMRAISLLCSNEILSNKGKVGFIGTTRKAIDFYSNNNERAVLLKQPIKGKKIFNFESLQFRCIILDSGMVLTLLMPLNMIVFLPTIQSGSCNKK